MKSRKDVYSRNKLYNIEFGRNKFKVCMIYTNSRVTKIVKCIILKQLFIILVFYLFNLYYEYKKITRNTPFDEATSRRLQVVNHGSSLIVHRFTITTCSQAIIAFSVAYHLPCSEE